MNKETKFRAMSDEDEILALQVFNKIHFATKEGTLPAHFGNGDAIMCKILLIRKHIEGDEGEKRDKSAKDYREHEFYAYKITDTGVDLHKRIIAKFKQESPYAVKDKKTIGFKP